MDGAPRCGGVIRFDAFTVDLQARELSRNSHRIRIQKQPYEVLVALLEQPGVIVTHEALRQRLWAEDTFVDFDHSLRTSILKLREALGDSASNPRFIETLPRQGYRFIGQVGHFKAERTLPVMDESPAAWEEPGTGRLPQQSSANLAPTAGMRPRRGLLARLRQGRALSYSLWAVVVTVLVLAVGGVLEDHYLLPIVEAPAAPMKVVPLTSFPAGEVQPSFSPDGSQVAFAWNGKEEDNGDIYVKVIGTESILRLTTNPALDRAPAWSPDGRYIAFHRHTASQDGIYLVPALGGPERKLYSPRLGGDWGFEHLDWSPDGKYLAFCENMPGKKLLRISALSVMTLQKRVLTTPPPSAMYGDWYPRYSPDGRTLAFQRGFAAGDAEICRVPAAGGEVKRLTYNADVGGLAWTPDGAHLIYSASRGGARGLWKMSMAGGENERLSVGMDDAYEPVLSRDGRRLAYLRGFIDVNIWRFQVPGEPGPAKPPSRLIASTRYDVGPQYSPDGRRIVFQSGRSGNCCEIWTSASDGSKAVQLTHFGGPLAGSPGWSPDGRQVVFDCNARGNDDIYVVSAEGGLPRCLTMESSNEVVPSWSRDGRWIYFASDRTGTWQVWKMPAVGGKAVQVTKGGAFAAFESYDGRTLYFAKGQNVPGLWKVPVGGGDEILVLKQLQGGLWGYWGLTRKGIYFYNAGTKAIEFYSFVTRKVARVLAPEKGPVSLYPGFSVSPDGRWILYGQMDTLSSDIMLVQNFHW